MIIVLFSQEVPHGRAITTKIPRTVPWNLSYVDRAYSPSDDELMGISPVMEGFTPYPMVTMNPALEVDDSKEKKPLLRDEYFTSQTPLELSEEINSILKIQSETSTRFTVTTYDTPLANIDVRSPTKISENLFTPERSVEYSSEEKISSNNTGTIYISSETAEENFSDMASSVELNLQISKEIYPKDKSDTQTTKVLKDKLLQDQKLLNDQKPTHYTTPSQDEKTSHDKEVPHYNSPSKDMKPPQDEVEEEQYKKPLREKKPLVFEMNSPQEVLTQETSQDISDETSPLKTLPLKTSGPHTSPVYMTSAVKLPTQKSPLKTLTPKKLPFEIKSREKLPKTKAVNDEDSEEKYSSGEKSPNVRGDASGSESESDSSAIPIEMGSEQEIAKSAENMLRLAPSTNYPTLPVDMLGMMSNSTYPHEESSSDSEAVDTELSLAPSLAQKVKKENQTDIDKTILTLLYLSDNEKNNDINGLLDDTKASQTNSETELTSGEDVSTKTKPESSLVFRSKNAEKYSKTVTGNNGFNNNVLFDILKEAVENDVFTDQLKKVRRRSNEDS